MSNKTNQSVLVNDTSSYYLKQYAALQFPGSVDNFGTKTPIHLLQQQEESEHSVSLREACDSDYDLDGAQFLFEGATYDSVTDLVKDNLCLDDEESIQKYNEHPRFDPFIPYEELEELDNHGIPTGRTRKACSCLLCDMCGYKETVDDSFDEPYK